MKRGPAKDLLMIGGLFLVTILFFWKVVFLGEVFYFRDTFRLFYPIKWFMVTAFRRGELPLWNPYLSNGVPFLADNTTAVLYPLNLIFLLLPLPVAFQWFILLHYFLGGVFVYLLLRSWRLSPYAALFGAIAFMFNTYLVQMSGNIIYLAIIWTPCFWWALHRALRQGTARAGILPGVVLAIQFLAGEPQSVFWSLSLGLLYLLFDPLETPASPPVPAGPSPHTHQLPAGSASSGGQVPAGRDGWAGGCRAVRQVWARGKIFIVAGFTSLGLSMIQFLPSLEMMTLSDRQQGLSYEASVFWSFHPLRLIEFIIPFFFGKPFSLYPEQYWGFFLQNFPDNSSWTDSIYSGYLPVFLALFALWAGRPRRRILFLGGITGTALLLALGRYTPVYALFYHALPVMRLFRYPEKYMALVTMGIALLAGFGVERFFRGEGQANKDPVQADRQLSRALAFWGGFTVLLLVAYALVVWQQEAVMQSMEQAIQGYSNPHFRPEAALAQIRTSFIFAICLGLSIFVTCFLWQRKAIGRCTAQGLFLLLLISDLFAISSQADFTAFSDLYDPLPPETPILRLLQPQEATPFRILRDKLPFYDQRDGDRLPLFLYERGKIWDKYTLLPNTGVMYGLYYMFGYSGYQLSRYLDLQQASYNPQPALLPHLLDLFNVRYLLIPHESDLGDTSRYRTVAVAPWNGMKVVENVQFLPRAFWVPRASVLQGKEAVLQRLRSSDFHPRAEVILEVEPDEREAVQRLATSNRPGEGERGRVTILAYTPHRVSLQVESPRQGFVVLSDTYYPGWKAFLDGVPTRIFRADYAIRAVAVEEGRHRIDFVYDPWTVKAGALISGLTLLGIGVVGIRKGKL
ncbi:MAG: hypothetical protein D6736_00625 [Nitrospinota bacterium]|nr:MAG: hypothetical protein D6736_00625 [Nitrospinota bacterium]